MKVDTKTAVHAYAAAYAEMLNRPNLSYPRIICLNTETGEVESGYYEQSAISGAWHCGPNMVTIEKLGQAPECGDFGDDVSARAVAEAFGDEMEYKIETAVAEHERTVADAD